MNCFTDVPFICPPYRCWVRHILLSLSVVQTQHVPLYLLPPPTQNPTMPHLTMIFPPVGAEDRSKAKETELLEDIIAEEEELFQDEAYASWWVV